MILDIQKIREQFPALALSDAGKPRVYLDNPAGTQVPQRVVERMSDYLIKCNANSGGLFQTSRDTDEIKSETHQAMAEFLNAPSADEIVFGPNMTTLTYSISRSIGRWLKPGDQVILTKMDHDANVSPWMQMAEDRGVEIKWLPFNRESYQYELSELANLLDKSVKLVAVNYASNAIGTINDVKAITKMAHDAGAMVFVDAVQYAPHGSTDVQDLGCDFLACSAYKFFGPHQGILWGKREFLEKLEAYRVRPAGDDLPYKFESGTQSYEGQAGALGALEYLTWIGETAGGDYLDQFSHFSGRRQLLHAGMAAIKASEKQLSAHLIAGLQQIPGVKIHGITNAKSLDQRVPTVSFTMDNVSPKRIAQRLAEENIFVWDGDYYAVEVVKHLGLADKGGMVRVGPVHYNTNAELDRLLAVVSEIK